MASVYERMMRRVRRDPVLGCLIYTGSKDGGGYGTVATRKGSAPAKAHRVAYEHHHGKIPAGMYICHHCDTPSCVELTHLFAGTQTDNMRDCANKKRINPQSCRNLRPGRRGYRGAGPKNEERSHG